MRNVRKVLEMYRWMGVLTLLLLGPCIRHAHAEEPDAREFVVTGPQCAPTLHEQIPDHEFHAGFSFMHADADYQSSAADDFTPEDFFPYRLMPGDAAPSDIPVVRTVRWWGAYESALAGVECADIPDGEEFAISIREDVAGIPGGVIVSYAGVQPSRHATGRSVRLVGIHREFEYSFSLPEPFAPDWGGRYWLEIASLTEDQCAWSWLTAPERHSGNFLAYWDQNGLGLAPVPVSLAWTIEGAASPCVLAGSQPPNEAVDVRAPHLPGWSSIHLAWGGSREEVQPADFFVYSSHGYQVSIESIEETPTGLRLDFSSSMMPCETWNITILETGEHSSLARYPGDINSDGVLSWIDLYALVTCLGNGTCGALHNCDVTGDGKCDPGDSLELMHWLTIQDSEP